MSQIDRKKKIILFGDDVGIPILISICNDLNLTISAVVFSNKITYRKDLYETYSKLYKIFLFEENFQSQIAEFIKNEKIFFGLIYSYDVLIKENILNIENFELVNIHAGKLPEYRGANVLNWSIINGEKKTFISLHKVEKEIDSGDLIYELEVQIDEMDTASSLLDKINLKIISEAPNILYLYLEKSIKTYKQKGVIRYFRKRKPEDGFFTWVGSNYEIYNLIRALVSPWPGARYVNKNGTLVIIDSFQTLEEIEILRKAEEER